MSVISIPSFTEINNVVYYEISVRLPLRSIQTSKRYTEFEALVRSLCIELGISKSDFPYSFPSKAGLFVSKLKVARERQEKFAHMLAQLIKDRNIQNSSILHKFLMLPPNFKFTRDYFEVKNDINIDEKLVISDAVGDITQIQWLSYLKNLKSMIENLDRKECLAAMVSNRNKATKYIRPNLEKLANALQHMALQGTISSEELKRKTSMISSLQSEMKDIFTDKPSQPLRGSNVGTLKCSQNVNKPVETVTTTKLSNTDLLQHQKQIHQEQEQDLEKLRKVIARQRSMGEAINREIEEQSEILDTFSEEIDQTGEKVQLARKSVKKIT